MLFGTAESRALIQIAAYTIYETGIGTGAMGRLQAEKEATAPRGGMTDGPNKRLSRNRTSTCET